jgi:putative ABC transport system permease protein
MSNFIEVFVQPGLILGLCYGIAAIGVSLPLRFLGTADFTAIGAIMLGGMVTIWITNLSHYWIVGLFCGPLAAGMLGLFTAFLTLYKRLNVPLMLAGIICFTASQSLGLIAKDGQVALDSSHLWDNRDQVRLDSAHFLFQSFIWRDAIIVAAIALTICFAGGIFARSKFGCFAFAMCANSRFVKFRHRSSRETTVFLLFISNFLIGLCGGLLAMADSEAYMQIHVEFLSLTLGAIFAGQAVVQCFARILKKQLPAEFPLETHVENPETHSGFWETFRLSLSTQRDDSGRMWFVFLSYICASIFLNCVTQAVRGHTFFHVPPAWEHVIVAAIIIGGLLVSQLNSIRVKKYC